MVDAVAQHAGGKVVTTQGVPGATSTDTSGIPAAVAMAKTAETVVLVVGTDLSWAAEGHDAKQINFTSAQVQLMDGVIAVASNPVVIVLLTATPLDISAYLNNPKVGASKHSNLALIDSPVSPVVLPTRNHCETVVCSLLDIARVCLLKPTTLIPSQFNIPQCNTPQLDTSRYNSFKFISIHHRQSCMLASRLSQRWVSATCCTD